MFYIVCYDISEDRKRTRFAKQLEYHALSRFQYSVFIGPLPKPRYEQLKQWIKTNLVLTDTDSIAFIAVSESALEKMLMLGEKTVDKAYLLHRTHTLFV
jgi:CRISPR-associated protein Cas2